MLGLSPSPYKVPGPVLGANMGQSLANMETMTLWHDFPWKPTKNVSESITQSVLTVLLPRRQDMAEVLRGR